MLRIISGKTFQRESRIAEDKIFGLCSLNFMSNFAFTRIQIMMFTLNMIPIKKFAFSLLIMITPGFASSVEPTDGDTVALTPWELLGEDDGLEDMFNSVSSFQMDLVNFAKLHLGKKYKPGGKGPYVFDCSGFTSFVFGNFDISLSPASRMQGKEGEQVTLGELEIGDLMFFSGRRGGKTVGHVGMVIDVNKDTGEIKFIHASSKHGIVIQSFPDGAYYSRHYLHSTRVINNKNDRQTKQESP